MSGIRALSLLACQLYVDSYLKMDYLTGLSEATSTRIKNFKSMKASWMKKVKSKGLEEIVAQLVIWISDGLRIIDFMETVSLYWQMELFHSRGITILITNPDLTEKTSQNILKMLNQITLLKDQETTNITSI